MDVTFKKEVFILKINGTNHTNLNPYKNLVQKHDVLKKPIQKSDELQISNEAKSMLENHQPSADRIQRINTIKEAVQSGEYEIDFEKTADKMIDYWTKSK